MQCDYCDSKATVFFTQILDGSSKKSCLCEKCAITNGVTDPEGFLLGDMAPSEISTPQVPELDEVLFSDQQPDMEMAARETCPNCGFTFEDLKKTGRLGCSECYQIFRQEIQNNLGGMHKDTSHVGRAPQGLVEFFKYQKQLKELKQKLGTSIAAEDFEKAAALRDEIQQLSASAAKESANKDNQNSNEV